MVTLWLGHRLYQFHIICGCVHCRSIAYSSQIEVTVFHFCTTVLSNLWFHRVDNRRLLITRQRTFFKSKSSAVPSVPQPTWSRFPGRRDGIDVHFAVSMYAMCSCHATPVGNCHSQSRVLRAPHPNSPTTNKVIKKKIKFLL